MMTIQSVFSGWIFGQLGVSPNSSTSSISSLQIRVQVLSSNSLPLLKCLHSTHSLPGEKKNHQSGHQLISSSFPDNLCASVCKLTSSWCRHQDRWGTCHMWPHRHRAGCTHRPRTHTDPCHCTTDPGWTYRCQYVWSSYSSHPASLVHTGRNHSYRHHGLGGRQERMEEVRKRVT